MDVIRLLHLSDLHLALKHPIYRRTRVSRECFNSIARFTYEWRDVLDGFLVTGDIADTGKKDDLIFAKSLFFPQKEEFQIAQRTASNQIFPLHIGNKPTILLPGNHDRFHFPTLAPDSKNFDNIFFGYWKDVGKGVGFYLLPDDNAPKFMIVYADLTLKSWLDCPLGFHFGQGRAYSDRLKRLARITKENAKKYGKIPVVWAFHFPPDPLPGIKARIPYWLTLNNSAQLIREAEIAGIKYIFCGHVHKFSYYNASITKTVWVYCAGSSTCLKPLVQPAIHLIEIRLKNNNIDRLMVYPLRWNGVTFA